MTPTFLTLYPTTLVQNADNARNVGLGFTIILLLGFLLCIPFISENKAKAIAKEEAEKKWGPKYTISVSYAKLDDWTWHVHGYRAHGLGGAEFDVYVNAKTRKIVRSN